MTPDLPESSLRLLNRLVEHSQINVLSFIRGEKNRIGDELGIDVIEINKCINQFIEMGFFEWRCPGNRGDIIIKRKTVDEANKIAEKNKG